MAATLSVAEAAAVLKPAAIRYLRAVVRGKPRASDLPHVAAAEAWTGALVTVATESWREGRQVLTPRGQGLLAHLDGSDGDLCEQVVGAMEAVKLVHHRVWREVMAWAGEAAHYCGPTLDEDGVVSVCRLKGANRRSDRTLSIRIGRYGGAYATLREHVHGQEVRLCPLVNASSGNSVKEALQALGDPWMERKSRGDA